MKNEAILTKDDFALLSGSRLGANTVYQRLLVLRAAINAKLKKKEVEFSAVVAFPSISQNKDVRRAGWLGYLPPADRLIDANTNPLVFQPSVSVLLMGEGNWRGEEPGLQVVLEFGDDRKCHPARNQFRKFINASDFLSLRFLGHDMALRLRGFADTTTVLDSASALDSFRNGGARRYDVERHYIVLGRFYSIDEAASLGAHAVEEISERIRRLMMLLINFGSSLV
ncbi:MAG: hypothetical protein HRF49_09915 [bacterium]|jgi:hypothetical protein